MTFKSLITKIINRDNMVKDFDYIKEIDSSFLNKHVVIRIDNGIYAGKVTEIKSFGDLEDMSFTNLILEDTMLLYIIYDSNFLSYFAENGIENSKVYNFPCKKEKCRLLVSEIFELSEKAKLSLETIKLVIQFHET